jgi:hypothetical protein
MLQLWLWRMLWLPGRVDLTRPPAAGQLQAPGRLMPYFPHTSPNACHPL